MYDIDLSKDAVNYGTIADEDEVKFAIQCNGFVTESNFSKVKFTSDKALEHGGFGRFNIAVLVCTLMIFNNVCIVLLSPAILPDLIRCSLPLNDLQTLITVSLVYAGYFIGNTTFGTISDRYGRKRTILLSTACSAFFSLLFSFSTSFTWVCFFHLVIGIVSSGMAFCTSLCVEFMPTDKRSYTMLIGLVIFVFSAWYSLVSWIFLDFEENWRWILRTGHALPIAMSFPIYYYLVPESPRYLLTIGKTQQAKNVFVKIWKQNKVEPLKGELVHFGEVKERGSMVESLKQPYLLSTLLLSTFWMINGLTYYGGIFLVTQLEKSCEGKTSKEVKSCITSKDLLNVFLTSLGDIPGVLVSLPLMERWGRKKTLAFSSVILTISLVPLQFCQIVDYSWVPVSFIRAAGTAVDSALEVYVPEVYPTYFRNAAVSTVKIGERIGMIATPFLSRFLINVNYNVALGILTILTFSTIFIAACLPKETARVHLTDVH